MFPTDRTKDNAAQFLESVQGELHVQAHKLVQRFREIRDGLVHDQQQLAAQRGIAQNRRPDRVWAPLMFRAREKDPQLYLEWFITAPSKERGKYFKARVARPKGAAGNYDIRSLKAACPDYLHHLVEETETEARYLRHRLRLLTQARRLVGTLFTPP